MSTEFRGKLTWKKGGNLLITGTFLRVLWLIILHKRPIPDKQGITTSVKTMSI